MWLSCPATTASSKAFRFCFLFLRSLLVRLTRDRVDGQKLSSANVLSAPVWSEETKKYTGFLDMRDLVSSVVFIAEHASNCQTKTLADLFVNAKWVGGAFTVTYLSRRNPFRSVKASDSLATVLELLSKKGPGRMKRVAVVDEAGKIVNIVSQTTLVAYLSSQIASHHLYVGKTVEELHLGSAPPISIQEQAPAIEAFKLMDTKQITGLAIVDAQGKLVGNISARDLKIFIKHIDFGKLVQPVGEFVKHLRQFALDIKSPTITVFGSAKFELVIGKLAATKVHRLFVVDDETHFRPLRVISLADVLSAVLQKK
jgi:CBS domain-containing protein